MKQSSMGNDHCSAAATGPWSFLSEDEAGICRRFMEHGHVIFPAEDRAALVKIQTRAATLAALHLDLPMRQD